MATHPVLHCESVFQQTHNDTNVELKSKKISRKEGRERKTNFRRLKLLLSRLQNHKSKMRILGKRRSYSVTDPDATAMKKRSEEVIKPSYNEGIATENGLVLDYTISNTSGDTDKFIALVEGVQENTGKTPESITADSAYGSEENYEYMEEKKIKPNVKYPLYHPEKNKKWRQKKVRPSEFKYQVQTDTYLCPEGKVLSFNGVKYSKGAQNREAQNEEDQNRRETKVYMASASDCSACRFQKDCTQGKSRYLYIAINYERKKKNAREQLASKEGRDLSKQRPHGVETVFAQKKYNAKYRRYLMRGREKVEIEAGLFYTAYNLEKMYRHAMKALGENNKIPPLIAASFA